MIKIPELPFLLTPQKVDPTSDLSQLIETVSQLVQSTQLLMDEIFNERIGGANLGDVFEIGNDDILALRLYENGGLEKINKQLSVKVNNSGGLQLSADGIAIKLKGDGGLLVDDDGAGIKLADETLKLSNSGLSLNPKYAEIHVADASTAQSIPTGAGYTKLTAFTDDGLSLDCTADSSNNKITLTKTGVYRVNSSISFSSGTANVVWSLVAFLDGNEQHQCHMRRKTTVAGDIVPGSLSGFIDVTSVPVDLDVRARHNNGGSVNITINYANLNVQYLSPT